MFNPSEKAKELIEKFHKMGDIYPVTTYAHAKACAIILCDELINEASQYGMAGTSSIKYWRSVKSIINQ